MGRTTVKVTYEVWRRRPNQAPWKHGDRTVMRCKATDLAERLTAIRSATAATENVDEDEVFVKFKVGRGQWSEHP